MNAQTPAGPLDLELIREVPLSPEAMFRGWTVPEVLKRWFCPRPWQVVDCEIDLRPGGIFSTMMQGPNGVAMPRGDGCWLVVEPPHHLVWTNMLGPDFRPQIVPPPGFGFVCDLRFEPVGNGLTRYHARVMHADAAGKAAHQTMGFEAGWSAALAQLVELER